MSSFYKNVCVLMFIYIIIHCVVSGACWVNCHNLFDAAAGFGGYRESGYGRDGGKEVSS